MTAATITGLGCVCALGEGVPAFWDALLAGRSGIKDIEEFPQDGLRNVKAGVLRVSPALRARAERDGIDARLLLFAAAALDEALADAGLAPGTPDTPLAGRGRKAALVCGTSLGMSLVAPDIVGETLAEYDGRDGRANADLAALAEALDRRYGFGGDVSIVSTACASGTHAIALALDMIRHDGYDLVVAGGADSLDRMKYLGHSALNTLTTDLPRPFSTRREGTLFGEGAGFLVLEAPHRAQERAGARRHHGTCLGAGYSTDINHVTAPDPEGAGGAMAIRAAIEDAGLEPDAIDHVNLHGSGTGLNDTAEFSALTAVFGDRVRRLPSTSIKAAVGHAMGAAGAIEAVASVLALRDGLVPPTVNVPAEDVAFALDLVTGSGRRVEGMRHALSNSFGFGGANGAVVFGR